MNPNPRSYKTKHGPVYRVTFDLLKEDYEDFMDADTAGWTGEAEIEVTGVNDKIQEEPEKQQKPYAGKPIGPLCREALDAAENTMWWLYLGNISAPVERMTSYYAAKAIKDICYVETRKAFDYDEQAGERWKDLRKSYLEWSKRRATFEGRVY